jgi:hypothetical protein
MTEGQKDWLKFFGFLGLFAAEVLALVVGCVVLEVLAKHFLSAIGF